MRQYLICILGGTGFVGTHLANRLTQDGHHLRVLTRRRERSRHLLVIPTLELIQSDVHDAEQLALNFRDCDIVINLVGILNEKGNDGREFHHVHVDLSQKVITACQATGVKRILHMSALNADTRDGPSHYLRTKGEAEDLVHAAGKDGIQVTSFRPSVIFGPDDDFFNRFALLLQLSPIMPLACPRTYFSPVYIDDVTEVFVRSLEKSCHVGQRYNLCGPDTYTLKELVEYTATQIRNYSLIIPLSDALSRLQASLLEFVPGKPFSRDNYLSMQQDCTCDKNDLEVFDIKPTPLEIVVPSYLGRRNFKARFDYLRQMARRGE